MILDTWTQQSARPQLCVYRNYTLSISDTMSALVAHVA